MNLASIFDNYLQKIYGKKINLRTKLDKFYKDNEELADEFIYSYHVNSMNTFSVDFLATRNALAHGETIEVDEKLIELIIRTRFICSYIILVNLSFTHLEAVQTLLNFRQRNPKYYF